MNKLYSTTVGSGTVPHIGYGPAHGFTEGAFPVPCSTEELRTREGDGVVMLNPEDFSVSIGLRSAAVTVGTSATPLPANPLENRRALVIHNNGSNTVFLGDSSVLRLLDYPLPQARRSLSISRITLML